MPEYRSFSQTTFRRVYNSTDGTNWFINTGWADGAAGTDCDVCAWPGVVCDGNGRVTSLNLNGYNLTGPLPAEIGNLSELQYLVMVDNNLSGSLPGSIGNLAELVLLYLNQNNLSGTIPASIGNLDNLVDLGLSSNQFSGAIPPSIGDMASIEQLIFADNQLSGDIPPELGNLVSLQNLDLSANMLSGEIPAEIGNLANLGGLSLSNNQLTGSIPLETGNLSNLFGLYIDNNNLSGDIPAFWGNFPNLNTLALHNNQLSGSIPADLASLANLISLNLSGNQLSGDIPPEIGSLPALEELYLSGNQLTGAIPAELGSLSNLIEFNLSDNDLSGCLPPELLDLCAHVSTGDISGNPNLDNQDWADFCANQTGACVACTHPDYAALMALYNSTDGANWTNNTGWIDGAAGTDCDVCTWHGVYCNGNGRVAQLYLYGNNLVGAFPAEVGDLTSLYELDLSGNQLSGILSTAISDLSGLNLTFLNLAENQFTGTIPVEIGNFTTLESLTLANNPLSGSIPSEIGNLINMRYLNLYADQITGSLPPELGNLTNLVSLGLFNNQLSGCIPSSYSVFCSNGTYVNMSNNAGLPGGGDFAAFCANGTGADADADGYCAGTGPNADCDDTNDDINPGATEICNGVDDDCDGQTDEGLTQHPDYAALMALYNSTDGANWTNNTGWTDGAAGTDCDVCTWHGVYCNGNGRVAQLYLYGNNLVGAFPAEVGDLTSLYELDLSGNQLSGVLSTAISDLSGLNLTFLNLAENQFTGTIPVEIGNFTTLESLTLANNPLSGSIPSEIGNLTNMRYLNLYTNQITGSLPPELGNLTNLVSLGLFNNQLSGCIPPSYSVFCSNGTYVNMSNNAGLPGGGDFAAFCANGTGADADADGYCAGTGPNADCDDTNDDINPGATEICDGADNDCDGQTDESNCSIEFSGTILWEHDDTSGVKDANVKLTGSATASDLTDIAGDFLIATTQATGSFTLKPTKNINKFNGVTTADAVAIQQHVTLFNPISDPYKLVCADVNKSNSISTLDAALIIQALLGNPAANAIFNTSWRFVPSSHTMQMPPWGFPEQRTYLNISAPQTGQDFIGMKIGDVTAAYANPAGFGAGEPLVLRVKDRTLVPGERFDLELIADQTDDLAAFQFALYFDPVQLQFEAIEPASGGLPLTADHFGTYNAQEGEIRAVWSQATGLRIEEAAPLFRLRFKALQNGARLSEVFHLDDAVLPALAYTGKLAESKVELAFSEATATNDPAATSILQLQVSPNPFREETTVAFTLPAAGEAQLRVLDLNGRELLRINNTYPAGHHRETLRLDNITASGVLTCELITPFGVATRKMVLARL